MTMNKKEIREELIQNILSDLNSNFERIRGQVFNQNTKGGGYELIIKEFLKEYFSNFLDFYTRVGVIDRNLDIFNVMNATENEFDVVTLFNNSSPKMVYKLVNFNYLPLDGVAFIMEVKQTLSKSNLKKDLTKLNKLNKLQLERPRSMRYMNVDYPDVVKRPLRILFYYESEINEETRNNLLEQYIDSWDFLVVFKSDITLGNTRVPVVQSLSDKGKNSAILIMKGGAIITFLWIVPHSLEIYNIRDTASLFYKLSVFKMFGMEL